MHGTDFLRRNFAYGSPGAARVTEPGPPVALSIFADRAHVRAVIRDDAEAAGLTVATEGALPDLLEGSARPLGEVVLVDCPCVDGQALAALARLDMRAARCEARLIVSTSVEALDEVFACMDQSSPVLLVDPTRAERVIALGQVLAGLSSGRVRELSDDDRLMLLRLSEQVGQIAGQIERLAPPGSEVKEMPAAFRFGERPGGGERLSAGLIARPPGRSGPRDRTARPALPDARQLRALIRRRQLRARYFDAGLFADPAWDMLLDLAAARGEHKRVSVTSLCIASGVPPTTALRWIGQMIDAGLFLRVCDDSDRRRAFIELTEKAAAGMARYFAEVG